MTRLRIELRSSRPLANTLLIWPEFLNLRILIFCRILRKLPSTHAMSCTPLLLFTPLEFFRSVLADSFSLESECQQVALSLQDTSQDSGRS